MNKYRTKSNDNVQVVEETDDKTKDVHEQRKKAPRCIKCKRKTYGHEGPYGPKNCTMSMLTEEELEEDDTKKLQEKAQKDDEKKTWTRNEQKLKLKKRS